MSLKNRSVVPRTRQESEGSRHVLARTSPHAILIVRAGQICFANAAAAKLFGVDAPERLLGRNPLEILPVDLHGVTRMVMEAAERGDDLPPARACLSRPFGTAHALEMFLAPMDNAENGAFQIVLRDMSHTIGFVKALEESESRLKKAQAMAHVGNWRIDLKTRSIWGSEEALRIYGLDPATQTREVAVVQELVDPADRSRLDAALAGLIAGTGRYEVEFRIKRFSDGAQRFMQSRAERMVDDDGAAVAVVGVVQDITERRIAEEALKENEKHFRLFFELGLIGMAFSSAEGIITDANRKLSEMLGYSKDQLVGMSWAELTHTEDLPVTVDRRNSVAAGETDGYALEKRLLRRDGQVVHTFISVRCLRRENGS
ncbi:MAG TPA: PAS domain S-box protein, partial [Spirochaetia bacterium]|nr:PAS domain S-box protein [Spirochaetia bacterium]